MNYKVYTAILLIILLASFLRFYKLAEIPPSLNWDEVSIGYNAYSIFKTAKDEWGQFLPLSFRAFGDYKLPLYIYLDVPFVAVLGLNETAVRLPSVISGVGVVLLAFLVLKELTKSNSLSLWGMFISATMPWLIILSRVALEANLTLFLTLTSFYLFLLSFRKKGILPYCSVALGLSTFSYNSSRVLILFFLLLTAIFSFQHQRKKEVFIALLILLIFMSVAFFQALTIDSGARYKWTTILDEGAITRINQLRGLSGLPPALDQLIYNKATYFMVTASKNYISHFNPNFLFLNQNTSQQALRMNGSQKNLPEGILRSLLRSSSFLAGGSNLQFSIPNTGQIYLVLLPLILLGIWKMMQRKEKWQLFILGWLLIAPIPGAITRDAPHPLRTIFLTIPLLFSAVMGIKWSRDFFAPKIFRPFVALILLILIVNTYSFWQNYTGDYRKNYSQAWQYGYKQAVEFVKENLANYDRIIFTKKYGEPHEFVLFYLKYDPYKYQSNRNLIRYQQSDWFWVDRFDKFEFINDWEIKDKVLGASNTLLIASPGNYPTGAQVLETIKFLDGKSAFDIVAVNRLKYN